MPTPMLRLGYTAQATEAIEFMDDFFLRSGSKHPSVLELPFAKHEIQWGRSNGEKTYVHGKLNGSDELSLEIDLWELELPLEGKPRFLVHQVSGSWLKLCKPRDFYLETMKVVLVAASFLIFAKQNPHSSQGAVWRYVRKECRDFKAKPNHNDLAQASLLLESIVRTDPILQASPIVLQFFPSLPEITRDQIVQGSRKLLPVKREFSPVAEDPSSAKPLEICSVEATPPAAETSKGMPSSQSTPRMRSLAEFASDSEVPLVVNPPNAKKRKAGRAAGSGPRRKGNKIDQGSVVGDEDWVDEPDVCAFCDDGVEQGDKLLCCDGPCMRSFHPTVDSGRQNQCVTLCLSKTVVSKKSWVCPNCEAAQHQCFACGKLGDSASSSAFQEVFLCGAKKCKRFYHPDCVAELLVPLPARQNMASSIQQKLETFICPLHKCASCQVEEDKTDPDLCLIKCRRCPVAWHEKCLPVPCRTQLWPLEGGKYVMYCGRHTLDPNLLTPKRDHIIFPDSQKAVNGTSRKLGLRSVTKRKTSSVSPGTRHHNFSPYQKVREIMSHVCRVVTLKMVKKKLRHSPPI